MTNFERLKHLTPSELAKELALIASWNRTEYKKACMTPGLEPFMREWLGSESKYQHYYQCICTKEKGEFLQRMADLYDQGKEIQPVEEAHWILCDDDCDTWLECSSCGRTVMIDEDECIHLDNLTHQQEIEWLSIFTNDYPHCHCGARMIVEDSNEDQAD